jgi:GMP synthase (glutamine-hydrolysing)
MQPILILKTGQTLTTISSKFGDFEAWIMAGMDLPSNSFQTVSVFQGEQLPPLENVSGIVITGSPAMVTEKLAWIETSQHYLVNAVETGVPVLGICFGHQLLAQALGGKVDLNPAGREIGTTSITVSDDAGEDALFCGMSGKFKVHTTHMQSVMELPPGTTILAGNIVDNHHALRFAENAWGIQFHPEFDEEIMGGYIRERYDDILSEGQDPNKLLLQVTQAREAQELLKQFAAIISEQMET